MATLASLFDGIGGFPLAASRAGIKPKWASEFDKYAMSVTEKHFPDMVHYGDITKLVDREDLPMVDVISFGSPCQDLSLAGKRKGLEGERSGLFVAAVELIRNMRRRSNGMYPRFILWENVPGAFSSNKGQDFRRVLSEIAEAEIPMPGNGRWAECGMVELSDREICWRVLDAQYWGVPQRRKRIFLVADFAGKRAKEILLEPEGLRGNITESGTEGQGTPSVIEESTRKSDTVIGYDMTHACDVVREYSDKTPTLQARMGTGGNQVPLVLNKESYCIQGSMINRKDKNGPQGSGINKEKSFTLNTIDRHCVATIKDTTHVYTIDRTSVQSGVGLNRNVIVGEDNIAPTCLATGPSVVAKIDERCVDDTIPYTMLMRAGKPGGGKGALIQTDKSATLGTTNCQILYQPKTQVAFGLCAMASNSMKSDNPNSGCYVAETAKTIDASGGNPTCNQGGIVIVEEKQDVDTDSRNILVGKAKAWDGGDVSPTLTCSNAGGAQRMPDKNNFTCVLEKKTELGTVSGNQIFPTLMANCGTKLWSGNQECFSGDFYIADSDYLVRRLTPLECERLQGYPDDWTAGQSDTQRYKQCGNSVAVPCVEYIMQGIAKVFKEDENE